MNPIWGHVAGVVTVILMVTFIGIWIWAWRKKHKRVFDRMARLPLEDDSAPPATEPEDDSAGNGEDDSEETGR